MDWKAAAATFLTVFLAELGDKTQLATLGLASGNTRSLGSIFLGSSAALVLCSALAVVGGAALTKVVPLVWLERGGASLLVVIGVLMLWRSWHPAA